MYRYRVFALLATLAAMLPTVCADDFELAAGRPLFRDSSGIEIIQPAPGQDVFLCLTISCVGSGMTPPMLVELYLDGELLGGGDVVLQGGGVHAVQEVHLEEMQIFTAGSHLLMWVVDERDDVFEMDEDDNIAMMALGRSVAPVMRVEPTAVQFDHFLTVGSVKTLGDGNGPEAVPQGEPAEAGLNAPAGSTDGRGTVPIIIRLKKEKSATWKLGRARSEGRRAWLKRLRNLRAGRQKQVVRELRKKRLSRLRQMWLVDAISARARPEDIESIRSMAEVESVFVDQRMNFADNIVEGEPPAQPMAQTAWGVSKIRAPEVWDMGFTGAGVVVALIDSGVNYNHVDLAGQMWRNPGEIPGNGIDDDNNGEIDDVYGIDVIDDDNDPMDEDDHGTHVAGTIAGDGTAGTRTGVAPDCRIMAIRSVPGYLSDLVRSVEYALMQDAGVISISAGWEDPSWGIKSTVRHLAESVNDAGVLWVAAAGNGDSSGGHYPVPDDIITPAAIPSPNYGSGGRSCVLAIGATKSNDTIATFSSIGPTSWDGLPKPYKYRDYPFPPGLMKPDFCAPGVSIKSCSRTDINGYLYMSGTSMATPHVAGVVALMLSYNPYLTPLELANALDAGVVDLGSTGRDNYYGAGRIDALGAMNAIAEPPSSETVAIHNDGDADLVITLISKQSAASWLSFSPTRFPVVVPPGGMRPLFVRAAPNGVAAGTYTERLLIYSNDPAANPYPDGVGVTLVVHQPPPSIGLKTETVSLQAIAGDPQPSFLHTTVFNAGEGEFEWTAQPSASLLTAVPDTGLCTDVGNAIEISADPSSLAAGTYAEQVVITAPDADNSPQAMNVTLEVLTRASARAAFAGLDRTTGGAWTGKYGDGGYLLLNYTGAGDDIAALPPHITHSHSGSEAGVWTLDTADIRALEPPAAVPTRRATYRGGGNIAIAFDARGDVDYRLGVYCVDWDGSGRTQSIEVCDPDGGALLAGPVELDDFADGAYVIFRVYGSVEVRITSVEGPDAVASGVFWDRVWPRGDINGDGCVNVTDLMAVRANLGVSAEYVSPPQTDTDGDGNVNVLDLMAVRAALGNGPNCP